MGLGDLEKPAELWTMIVGKDGREYKNMFKCNSIKQFEEENPQLSEKINTEFQKWYKETGEKPAEAQLIKTGKEGGWSYKGTDGNTYKLGKFNNQLQMTKITPGGWSGGSGKSFTFMRTDMVMLGKIEVVEKVISGQGPTDSWRITKLSGDSVANMIFLLERQSSYTPATATTEKKDAAKEAEQEDSD